MIAATGSPSALAAFQAKAAAPSAELPTPVMETVRSDGADGPLA